MRKAGGVVTLKTPIKIGNLAISRYRLKPSGIGHNSSSVALPPDDFGKSDFYFKEDILNQLSYYDDTINLLKQTNPDVYAVYSRIGGMVLPGSKALMARDMNYVLEKTSIDRLPTFSSVVISRAANADKKDDIISARMLYAMRMYPGLIPGFQAGSSCVYSVGAVYSDDDKLKISSDAYISIMPDGTVKILKDISTKMVPIRGRDGIFSIPSKEPRIPLLIAGISERQKAKPESVASFLLAATLSPMIDAGNDIGFQIRATGKSTAVFNVSSGRTPYFFKDRDVTTNSNGSKKKIFHYVPSYTRSNGKKVVAHVKGLNRFMWNGYSIHIGKPGFDIPDLRRMTLSGYSIGSAVQPPPGMLSSEEVGDRIVKAFTSGFRPRRR